MPVRAYSTLSGLIDSDSDNDSQYASPQVIRRMGAKQSHNAQTRMPTKTTKSKIQARRASIGATAQKKSKKTAAKRPYQEDTDTEEVEENEFEHGDRNAVSVNSDGDELNDSIVVALPVKQVRQTKTKAPKLHSITETPEVSKQSKKQRAIKPKPATVEYTIQETQEDYMGIDGQEAESILEAAPQIVRSTSTAPRAISRQRAPSSNRHREISMQRQRDASLQRRRAGSASDTERSDPAMRRKLGDITKRFENLEMKHNNLKSVGIIQAEEKFDKLRKQHEASTKTANALIAALKLQLAEQETQLKTSKNARKQTEKLTADLAAQSAQREVATARLNEAQSENKKLSATLAAKRMAASTIETVSNKPPGSVVKPGSIRMIGSQEAAEAAKAASLKEDLYSDLSGLLIRSVKKEAEEDVYDCIQTGRNGTLHFKLAVMNEGASESYDEAQCAYVPHLDPSRDRELMELLGREADYLLDEISFPRPQAARFYARVVKALTEVKS